MTKKKEKPSRRENPTITFPLSRRICHISKRHRQTRGSYVWILHALCSLARSLFFPLFSVFFSLMNSFFRSQVLWIAPPPGSGCVTIKATVVEHRDVWYMDDTSLSKTICEDTSQGSSHEQPPILSKCCACYEAKYEVKIIIKTMNNFNMLY